MKDLRDLNARIRFGRYGTKTNFVQDSTALRIEELSREGYEIIVGNNPYLDKSRKYAGRKCIRISQVNGRQRPICLRTIWAVK